MLPNVLLQSVDFILSDGNPITGLVPVNDEKSIKYINIDEQAVIIEARLFKRIDFVFFRRFSDSRSSQVAAYVVDNSNNRLDKNSLSQLHRQVWLQGKAPLLYITSDSQIDILACARGPDFWNESKQEPQYKPVQEFKLGLLTTAGQISSELKKFSALRLADGTFWDDPDNRNLANYEKAAHQSLIQAVVETDKDLEGKANPVLRRLLLLMVLVKYLEDRKVFPNRWFSRFHKGAKNFFEVLQGGSVGEVNRLLTFLEGKFNGDIFDLQLLNGSKLTKSTLKKFADLVQARTLKHQRYLWDQFSFEHLPVEIISHLYQRFVEDGHGAVYTPHFLASLLLDHVMPYEELTGKERILDPACGSAVFLVGAFRRLVNLWRSRHNWRRPTVKTLKKILKNNIYGIDLDNSAIDLSAFSLSLAICDTLKPKVIWNKLKFDRLRNSNLFETDFFKLIFETKNGISNMLENKYDIIVGNPPFESKLTDNARDVDKIARASEDSRGKCPDNQSAYLFLEQALTLLSLQNGRICMIQPSSFLYNRNPYLFRFNLFSKHCIDTIFDFTSIRRMYKANKQTIAISARAVKPSENNHISHLTFRRTVSVNERICFELDHYDRHSVSQKEAESNFYIWRINLLGGGRLLDISKRFKDMRTIEKYMRDKGWKYNEGFTLGKKDKPAAFLHYKRYLPSKALTINGIDESRIKILKENKFERPREEESYLPPLILIRKISSIPVAYWDKGFLSYSHEIVGVHTSESSQLSKMYQYLCENNDFFRFMIILHGSCALAERETAILKRDIDLLPYPESKDTLLFSFWETALREDIIQYIEEYIRHGQNSKLLMKAASRDDLNLYSKLFIKMLGSVYSNLKASKPIFLNDLICQPFYFGRSPELEWINKNAEPELIKLVYYDNHAHLRTIRIIRFYDKNVFLIIKPDRLRYWIRSVAIRDADETLADLYRQGY